MRTLGRADGRACHCGLLTSWRFERQTLHSEGPRDLDKPVHLRVPLAANTSPRAHGGVAASPPALGERCGLLPRALELAQPSFLPRALQEVGLRVIVASPAPHADLAASTGRAVEVCGKHTGFSLALRGDVRSAAPRPLRPRGGGSPLECVRARVEPPCVYVRRGLLRRRTPPRPFCRRAQLASAGLVHVHGLRPQRGLAATILASPPTMPGSLLNPLCLAMPGSLLPSRCLAWRPVDS